MNGMIPEYSYDDYYQMYKNRLTNEFDHAFQAESGIKSIDNIDKVLQGEQLKNFNTFRNNIGNTIWTDSPYNMVPTKDPEAYANIFKRGKDYIIAVHGTPKGNVVLGNGVYEASHLAELFQLTGLIEKNANNIWTMSCYGGLQKPDTTIYGSKVASIHNNDVSIYDSLINAFGGKTPIKHINSLYTEQGKGGRFNFSEDFLKAEFEHMESPESMTWHLYRNELDTKVAAEFSKLGEQRAKVEFALGRNDITEEQREKLIAKHRELDGSIENVAKRLQAMEVRTVPTQRNPKSYGASTELTLEVGKDNKITEHIEHPNNINKKEIKQELGQESAISSHTTTPSLVDVSQYSEDFKETLKDAYNDLNNFDFLGSPHVPENMPWEDYIKLSRSKGELVRYWSKQNGYDFVSVNDYNTYWNWAYETHLDRKNPETYKLYEQTETHKLWKNMEDPDSEILGVDIDQIMWREIKPYKDEYKQFYLENADRLENLTYEQQQELWYEERKVRQIEKAKRPEREERIKAYVNDQTEQELNNNPQAEPVTEEVQQQKEEIKAEQQNPEQEALDTAGSEANTDATESSSLVIEKEVAETVPKTTEEVSEIASTVADAEQELAEQAQDVVEDAEKATDGLTMKELSGKGKLALGIAAAVILITTTSASRSANKGKDGDKPKEAKANKQYGYIGGMTTEYYTNMSKQDDLELASDISSYTYGNRRRY